VLIEYFAFCIRYIQFVFQNKLTNKNFPTNISGLVFSPLIWLILELWVFGEWTSIFKIRILGF